MNTPFALLSKNASEADPKLNPNIAAALGALSPLGAGLHTYFGGQKDVGQAVGTGAATLGGHIGGTVLGLLLAALSKGKVNPMLSAGLGGASGGMAAGGLMAQHHNKSAATEAPANPETDEKDRKDKAALRNRHILLALKRALQGGTIGAIGGGMAAADPTAGISGADPGLSGGQGALIGLLAGGLLGAGAGAAEGGLKRSVGMDPLLNTIATARRP